MRYVVAKVSRYTQAAVVSIGMPNTQRPPYLSVHIPRKSRLIEPVRMGVAISRPNWVSDSPRSSLMRIPMMEKMVHTAKHRVKAKVDKPSARYCAGFDGVLAMLRSLRLLIN